METDPRLRVNLQNHFAKFTWALCKSIWSWCKSTWHCVNPHDHYVNGWRKPFEQWSLLGMYGPLSQCCWPIHTLNWFCCQFCGSGEWCFYATECAGYSHCQAGKLKFSHGQHSETGTMNGLWSLHSTIQIQGQNDPAAPHPLAHHPLDAHYDDSVVDEPQLS